MNGYLKTSYIIYYYSQLHFIGTHWFLLFCPNYAVVPINRIKKRTKNFLKTDFYYYKSRIIGHTYIHTYTDIYVYI